MRWAAMLVLCGCGRIAFDARNTPNGDALSPDTARDGSGPDDAPMDAVTVIPGLVAHYQVDVPVNADSSGNGLHAECVGGTTCPAFVTGYVGNAGTFDGVDDRMRVPFATLLNTTSGFTIAAWIYPTATTGSHSIVSKAHDATATANTWQLELPNGPAPRFKTRTASGDEEIIGSTIILNGWLHVAGTWDGTTMRLYYNAMEIGTQSASGILFDTNDVTIGCDENSGAETGYFIGRIDEVRIYNRALTPAELDVLATP